VTCRITVSRRRETIASSTSVAYVAPSTYARTCENKVRGCNLETRVVSRDSVLELSSGCMIDGEQRAMGREAWETAALMPITIIGNLLIRNVTFNYRLSRDALHLLVKGQHGG
jgi:hypothetical protein